MNNESWLDELDAPSERYWDPEPDDRLIGRLVEQRTEVGKYDPHAVAILETPDGPIAVRVKHKVLADEWEAKRPLLGDMVGIRFVGEVAKKAGGTYFDYKLVVNRDEYALAVQAAHQVDDVDLADDDADDLWSSPSSESQSA